MILILLSNYSFFLRFLYLGIMFSAFYLKIVVLEKFNYVIVYQVNKNKIIRKLCII